MNGTCRVSAAWLALLCLAAQGVRAEDQCDGPVVQVLIHNASAAAAPPATVWGVLATFGGVPSLTNLSRPAVLRAAEPITACGTLERSPGSFFLVERGGCSFVDKYVAVLAAGGAGLLMYDDEPGCITMGGSLSNGSQPQPPRNASQPPAASIDRADGLALRAALAAAPPGAAPSLQLRLVEVPALDASALLLWLMAVGTVVAGSLWSGADYAHELKAAGAAAAAAAAAPGARRGGGGGAAAAGLDVLEVSAAGAVCFVLFSSAMLVLLYYFLSSKVLFYVILGGFCLAGGQALAMVLAPAATALLPERLAGRRLALPCGAGDATAAELLAGAAAAAAAVAWAAARNAGWGWVLQDALGVSLMLVVLRTLRLPDLRVACVLLPLCFLYDVFWVFVQPLLTSGASVMVEVAGGAGSHEFLPMLLRVPRLSRTPPILAGGYSLLGFGDVILPGLLVALCRRLDIAGRSTWHGGYYVACVMGYGAGLLLTYVALMFSWFGDQGQPALLYLVPCTLGVVLLLAATRGELRALLRASDAGAELGLQYREVLCDDDSDSGGSGGGSGFDAAAAAAASSTAAAAACAGRPALREGASLDGGEAGRRGGGSGGGGGGKRARGGASAVRVDADGRAGGGAAAAGAPQGSQPLTDAHV